MLGDDPGEPPAMTTTALSTAHQGHRELSVLELDDCMRLLRDHYVGRIGLSVGALPVVVPVNYAVSETHLVMCSEPGLKLEAARKGVVACLEIDDFDPLSHEGWSVLVTGRLVELTDPGDISQAQQLPLSPWTPMSDPHYLSLSTELVTGRRLHNP